MFPSSIRWRLQLWLAFLLVCLMSGFSVVVYQLQRVQQLSQIDEDLELRVAAVSSAVRGGPPPGPPGGPPSEGGFRRPSFRERPPGGDAFEPGMRRPPPPDGFDRPKQRDGGPGFHSRPREIRISPETASLFEASRNPAYFFKAWARDGTSLTASENAPADIPLPPRTGSDTRIHSRDRVSLRESYHFTELGECVLAGRSVLDHVASMRRLKLGLLAAGSALLAIGLGGGWWLTVRAIRPVEEISAAASRISAGNLSERIAGADADNELGRLAAVLNSTFARLESAFSHQKQFTADASHELRTPLAVMISEAQSALSQPRSAEEYREAIATCHDTAQQMRRLTNSLLELARVDAGTPVSEREPVEIADLVESCAHPLQRLALERRATLQCELSSCTVHAHRDRLQQVLINLISNAIYYNRPEGKVHVRTCHTDTQAVVTVSDTGVGISSEDLPHIFERFFRADKSRSRSEGRSGLGLAICKAILDAEGGTLEVSSELGTGSTFTVRLPKTGNSGG